MGCGLSQFGIPNNRLFCARDRFGEKPFHYVHVPGKRFAFASEIKALWAAGVVERRIHEEMLALYLDHDQVDVGEQSFYQNVLRLPQGHYLLLRANGTLIKERYWDIDLRQEEARPDSWYAEQFRDLFFESVRIRLRADVPVGSSLSGGLDSSTVVTVMDKLLPESAIQKLSQRGSDDPKQDEGNWIAQVTAMTTNVEPHAVWPTGEGMFEELARVFWHQDEPFLSSSIYAQCV